MSFQRIDHFGRGVHAHRFRENGKKVVKEKRQSGNVVEMRVRKYDIANIGALFVVYTARKAPRVERHAAVYHKACRMLSAGRRTVALERTG